MGTARENKLRMKAYKIAGHAYGLFANGQGTGSLGLSQGDFRKLGKDKESIVEGLANKYYDRLSKAYPEDKWNNQESIALDKMKIEDLANTLIDEKNPSNIKKKIEFSAYKDLIAPEEKGAKNWYQMDKEQIGKAMTERGFNPKNRNDVKQFFEKLSEHDINYNRGKIVDETLQGKSTESIFPDKLPNIPLLQKLAFAAYPAMTEEATRQSLTGDFDDSRMNRATVADVLANSAIGVLPSAKVFSGAVAQGAVAAGAEGARQLIKPTEGRISDVLLSGMSAGTVPMIGQRIGWTVSRGSSTAARRFGKEFSRGLRGADDPLMQERNALKQALIDARKQSVSTAENPYTTGNTWYANEASPQALATARKWSDAEAKLNALGFNTESKTNALSDNLASAEANLKAAKQAEREAILAKPKSRKKEVQLDYQENVRMHDQLREEAQAAYEDALKEMDAYENAATITKYGDELSVEDVIGQNPATVNAGPVVAYRAPKENGIEAALNAYDRPMVFSGGVSRAPGMDESTLASFTNMENKYKTAFPEAYQQALWYGDKKTSNTKALKFTRGAGRVIGGVGGRIEPITGSLASLLTGGDVDQKATRFKNSKWFKNLPKEKKNAIENALKGE